MHPKAQFAFHWCAQFSADTKLLHDQAINPCVRDREEMVLIFYVDGFLLFSPYKDKLDDMYASLWVYFNI